MKTLKICILFTLLFSCSKPVKETSTVAPALAPSVITATKVLESTFRYDSATVQAAAASTIKAGIPLRSFQAEACWSTESGRKEVAMACLLAWTIGQERSALLEKELSEMALNNRIGALAAIKMKFPLQNIGANDLAALLRQIPDDPIWLRASAVFIWLQTHTVPELSKATEIAELLRDAKPLLPADFRYSYLARLTLKPASAAAMLNDHCGPLVTGELRVRCWRFLSAFVDPVSGEGLPTSLLASVPPPDRAWQLFQLAMPERARLMKHYLNQ